MSSDCGGASAPFVSVVVPVFNDAFRLRLCLLGLAAQSYPKELFEVIVVDNGSTDLPEEVVKAFPFVRLLVERDPGSYAARNRGVSVAKGDVIAFTDSDCIPMPAWLERGVAALVAPVGCGLVGGAIELFYASPPNLSSTELYESAFAFPQAAYVVQSHYAATANMITFRSVLDRVGPFNATLRSGGDREWGNRVHAAGYQQTYAPEAVVFHPARRTLREVGGKAERVAGGFYERNRMKRWLLCRASALVVRGAVSGWRAVEGNPKLMTAGAKAKVRMVILYIAWRRFAELVRLEFGFQPRR